ncbi:MAG: DUF3857 domain-containing transglutaminase family protein [Pseudomonadota bacterium]
MKKRYAIRISGCIGVIAAFLTCLAPFALARENNKVSYAKRPDWVDVQTLPELNDNQAAKAESGVYYRLLDRQTAVREDHHEFYLRTTVQVTNRSGLEDAARLQFSFDPTDQDFTIHSVSIIRNGETFDRLDPDEITVFRQETEINDGVTDGELTVYSEIPSVRVGDLVDYEVSWKTSSEIWPGELFREFSVEWSVPVGLINERIIVSADKTLAIKNHATDIKPDIRSGENITEYVWRQTDSKIVSGQDAVPVTFPQWGSVAVSTVDSWSDIVNSLQVHYNTDLELPSEFKREQTWLISDSTHNDKITKAIRFVQSEIRYVADETGVGSHLPRKPATVLERGWGDCKDKSLLLVALLRSFGIEAYVALTDYSAGYALNKSLPSPYAFNHAITVIVSDGKRYWIDPTSSHQGGVFPEIINPAYGFGLPLLEGSEALWPIDIRTPAEPDKILAETFDFATLAEDGLHIDVKTTLLGREADSFRRSLSNGSVTALAADYLKYYREIYPGLESIGDLGVSDDFDQNRIVTTESYRLTVEKFRANDLYLEFPVQSDGVRNVLTEIIKDDRTAPISLPFPKHLRHVTTIKNTGFKMEGTEDYTVETPEFSHNRKSKPNGDMVTITFDLKTLAPEAGLEQLDKYVELTDQISDHAYLEYNLNEEFSINDFKMDLPTILFFTSLVLWIVFFGLAIWGAFNAINAQNAHIDEMTFFPIRGSKFVILNITTLGLYGIFWMFRCWRWERYKDQSQILPFWRSVFSWLWYIALYGSIRGEFDDEKRPPYWLGVLLAFAYFVSTIGASIASAAMEESGAAYIGITVFEGFIFLLILPMLVFVNKLNVGAEEAIARNSRWTPRTFIALIMGISLWVMMISISFLPA